MNAATDATLRIRPRPRRSMGPRAAWVSRIGTSTWSPRWRTSSSMSLRAKSSGRPKPALLTRMSIGGRSWATSTRSNPRRASWRAYSAPRPELAPVMSAVLVMSGRDAAVGVEGRVGERHPLPPERLHLLGAHLDLALREGREMRPLDLRAKRQEVHQRPRIERHV